ncbi:ABC transporter ATP-binding protein [Jeotgalicoccus sp. FSL K6-3177]|uniref:ABC transporter ATP-binding protein n=1 Tax=Jeotgalicoccus sp. FSL K6-3177 TaxID=2921494 RepID=UPI0030FD55DC
MLQINDLDFKYKTYDRRSGFINTVKDLMNRKYYYNEALKNINLNIKEGETVGLLGMNGAGKTTLIKCMVGLLTPTEGKINVNGFTPYEKDNHFLKNIGVVIGQKSQLIWDLSAMDSINLLRIIYEIPYPDFISRLEELTLMMKVKDLLHTPVRKLSLGQRMKFEIIASIIHYPPILILDEPTIGLDLISQKNIREFLVKLNKNRKTTIIITSHNMSDIDETCNRLVIIKEGEIKFDGPKDKLAGNLTDLFKVKITIENFDLNSLNKSNLEYKVSNENRVEFHIPINKVRLLMSYLDLHEIEYSNIEISKVPLEELIYNIFKEDEDYD